MLRLDVEHAFDTVGGPMELIKLLGKYCPATELAYPTVQMWRQRTAVPAKWIVPLIYALSQEGHDWRQFCTDDDEFAGASAPQPTRAATKANPPPPPPKSQAKTPRARARR